MLSIFEQTINRLNALAEVNDKILISFSGGKDSLIVLDLHCRKMKKLDVELSCCDYSDIYYSWIFKKIRKLENPIEIRGRLGIFDV